ncbi:1,4-dihydroxy-2-naphthoate octaprenyltransferase [Opitutales bacterium]|nr:1,4-dihydroxy-2-naphthoate octaprenyltransferase [Opitutales bacterium]
MFKHWLLATRPKTLVASILPVTAGFLLAYEKSKNVSIFMGFLCLIYCVFIQVGTNFANDYFDFIKGADDKRINAPKRMVSAGLVQPKVMLLATLLVFILGFVVGIVVMELVGGSRYLLVIGLLSLICGVGYTGGPYPLAYNGLGDIFVILFFGLVGVEATHYILILSAGELWQPNWILPLGVGFVINNLLVVNNYRDYEEDKKVQKKTLVVYFGKKFGLVLFLLGILVSTILIPFLIPSAWTTIFLAPLGFYVLFILRKAVTKTDYDKALSACAATVLLYTITLLLGYLEF